MNNNQMNNNQNNNYYENYTNNSSNNQNFINQAPTNNFLNPEVGTSKKRKVYKTLSIILFGVILVILGGIALVYTGIVKVNTITPKSLLLNIGNIGLNKGSGYQYEYQVYPENTTNKRVYFASSDESIFQVNEVSGYIEGKKEGTANLIIKSLDDNSVVDTSLITVTKKKENIPVEKITLSSERVVFDLSNRDSYMLLKVSTEPYNATSKTFDFYSSDTSIAAVDYNGKIVPTGFGKTIITVATKDGSAKAQCEVYVTDSENKRVYFTRPDNSQIVFPYDIKLEFNKLKLKPGSFRQVGFTLLPPEVTEDVITWISADSKIATVKDGLVTGVSVGKTIITAKTVNDLVATLEVEVTNEEINTSYLSFKEEEVVLNIYEKTDLKVNYDAYSTVSNFAFTSSDSSIVSVSGTGRITGLKTGEATITVSLPDDPNVSDSIKVKVTNIVNSSSVIASNISKVETNVGGSEQIKITTGIDENAGLNYEIKDTGVASINEDGLLIGKKAGETTVTVTNGEGMELEIPLKVNNIPATKISVTSEKDVLNVGETIQLETTVYPNNATNKEVTFTADNDNVSISKEGAIKAVKAGISIITAKLDDLELKYTIQTIGKNIKVEATKLKENQNLEPLTEAELEKIKYIDLTAAYVGTGKIEIIADFAKYGYSKYVNSMSCIGRSEDSKLNVKVKDRIVTYDSKYGDGTILLSCKVSLTNKTEVNLWPKTLDIATLKVSNFEFPKDDATPNKKTEVYEKVNINTDYVTNDKNCKSSDTNIATVNANGVVKLIKQGKATISCDDKNYIITAIEQLFYTGKVGEEVTLSSTNCKTSDSSIASVNNKNVVLMKKAGSAVIDCDYGHYEFSISNKDTSEPTTHNITIGLHTAGYTILHKNLTCTASNPNIAVYDGGTFTGKSLGTTVITCNDSNNNKIVYNIKVVSGKKSIITYLDETTTVKDTNCKVDNSNIAELNSSSDSTIFKPLSVGETEIVCKNYTYEYTVYKSIKRNTKLATIKKDETYKLESNNCTTSSNKAKISDDGLEITFTEVADNVIVQCDNFDYRFNVVDSKKNDETSTDSNKNVTTITKNFIYGGCYSCPSGYIAKAVAYFQSAEHFGCPGNNFTPTRSSGTGTLSCVAKDKINNKEHIINYTGEIDGDVTILDKISLSHSQTVPVGSTFEAKFTNYEKVKEYGNHSIEARYSNGTVIKKVTNTSSLSFEVTDAMFGKHIYIEFYSDYAAFDIVKSVIVTEKVLNCYIKDTGKAPVYDGLNVTAEYEVGEDCQLTDFDVAKCELIESFETSLSNNKLVIAGKLKSGLYGSRVCNMYISNKNSQPINVNIKYDYGKNDAQDNSKSDYDSFGFISGNGYLDRDDNPHIYKINVNDTVQTGLSFKYKGKLYTGSNVSKLVNIKSADSKIVKIVNGTKVKGISTGETNLQIIDKKTNKVLFTQLIRVVSKSEKNTYTCYGYQKAMPVYNCDTKSEYSVLATLYGSRKCYSKVEDSKCQENNSIYIKVDNYCVNSKDSILPSYDKPEFSDIFLSSSMPNYTAVVDSNYPNDKYVGQYVCNTSCDTANISECKKK